MDQSKQGQNSNKKICRYGKTCFRKNPIHFEEFSHPHLENILLKGKNSKNEYVIPDDLIGNNDIKVQLRFVEKQFKSAQDPVSEPLPKKPKNDDSSTESKKDTEKVEKVKETKPKLFPKDPSETSCPIPGPSKPVNSPKPKEKPIVSEIKEKDGKSDEKSTEKGEENSDSVPPFPPKIYEFVDVVLPRGKAAKKLEAAAPYNFFLTTITSSPKTHSEPLSITFQELLDPSLGDLESSVQINFVVDVSWILAHYFFAGQDQKPLLILHGDETEELSTISQFRKNVTAIKVKMCTPFSTHHTKMMIFGYKDNSVRIVISTANLYEDDWNNRTQGLWISPKCPQLDDAANSAAGESPTGFRGDLIRYLNSYNLPRLQEWVSKIKKCSFEEVNVFLISSTPGSHQTMQNGPQFGHLKLGHLLSKHSVQIEDSCPIIAQSSTIGSLGQNINSWVQTDFGVSLKKDSGPPRISRMPGFKMIYPSFNNVKNSHDHLLGGGCLPYRKDVHMKQPWLENHLHIWKANNRHRSQAVPHIKSYFRYSEKDGLYWFCLTSANLSKAAWGSINKGSKLEQVMRIQNYECGVLFLPKFVTKTSTFPLKEGGNVPIFPMPYDLPPVSYNLDDRPFFMDYLMS